MKRARDGLHPWLRSPLLDQPRYNAGEALNSSPDGEWRRSPLRGLGLTEKSKHHCVFPHDQRARNLHEVIPSPGGEASRARARYAGMKKKDRAARLKFLESTRANR